MSVPEKKEAAKAPPAERGWHLSFTLTRSDGEAEEKPRRRLTPLDVALLAAGLTLFLVEPFAISMLLSHYRGPRAVEACASSSQVVVVDAAHEPPPAAGEEAVKEHSDVITPLNARDPSSLIMSPGR